MIGLPVSDDQVLAKTYDGGMDLVCKTVDNRLGRKATPICGIQDMGVSV